MNHSQNETIKTYKKCLNDLKERLMGEYSEVNWLMQLAADNGVQVNNINND